MKSLSGCQLDLFFLTWLDFLERKRSCKHWLPRLWLMWGILMLCIGVETFRVAGWTWISTGSLEKWIWSLEATTKRHCKFAYECVCLILKKLRSGHLGKFQMTYIGGNEWKLKWIFFAQRHKGTKTQRHSTQATFALFTTLMLIRFPVPINEYALETPNRCQGFWMVFSGKHQEKMMSGNSEMR